MSANLKRFGVQGTRRYPWDERLPDGTPAIDAGTRPSAFRRFLDSQQNLPVDSEEAQPVVTAPEASRPRRFADFLNQPARLASVTAPVDSPSGPYVPPDDGQPTLPERPSRFLDFALKPPAANDPLTAKTQPLPPSAVSAQQRNTKPQFVDTGDRRQDLADYEQRLEAWRNPIHHGNRLLAGLKEAGESLVRGEGVVGAVGSLVHGIAEPNVRERRWRDAEEARAGRSLSLLDARAKERIGLEGQTVDNALKRSQIFKNYNPEQKPKQHVTVNDRAYVFDPNDGTYTDANLPGGAKLKQGTDELGLFLYDPDHPETPVVRPKGEELKQFVNVEGYGRMTPAQKYNADATGQERQYQHDRDEGDRRDKFGRESYEDAVRRQERDYSQSLSQWESAGREQGRLTKALEELNQAIANRDSAARDAADASLKPAERAEAERNRKYWDEQGLARRATVEKVSSSLESGYGDFVGRDEQGWFTRLKPRPVMPAAPQRPAPAGRAGSSARRYVDAQGYAKDHNVSVEEARKLINSTPGYAAAN